MELQKQKPDCWPPGAECHGLAQGYFEEVVKGLFCIMTVVVGDMVVCTSPTALSFIDQPGQPKQWILLCVFAMCMRCV